MLSAVRGVLPAQDIAAAQDLLEHGEWGEAFDLVCTQVYEYEINHSDAKRVDQARPSLDAPRTRHAAQGEMRCVARKKKPLGPTLGS